MWALIYNGVVIEVTDTDPAGRYHPDILTIDVAGQLVGVGWNYADDKFIPPDLALFLADKRHDALKAIAEKHTEMLVLATGGATSAERETWGVQAEWARKILSTGEDDGTLRPLAGETKEHLAIKIIGVDGKGGKAAAYRQLVGIASEIKRSAEKAVEALALESVDDLSALDALLETAKQQALAALQQATATGE